MRYTTPFANRSFRRLPRTCYTVLPFLLLANYIILFYFESVSNKVFPSDTFHPPTPVTNPHETHDKIGSDYWTWETISQFKSSTTPVESNDCATFPTHLLNAIQIVLKVGSADDPARTNSQLSSVIKCISNVIIVSDRNHTYGDKHEAFDVFASLPPETYLTEEDLIDYNSQKNVSLETLRQGHRGWKLDKYKFLPAVEHAVSQNDKAKWYVFLESDTYVFWDNLFRLLENYDEELPYYLGSPSPGKPIPETAENGDGERVWFAYGGPGYVLSAPAALRLVERRRNKIAIKGPRLTQEYKEDIRADCCGDSILGWALHDKAGVDISGLWPMFNPESLHGIPFGRKYWCEPVISLHKTHIEDYVKVFEWDNNRNRSQGPLLYRDLISYHPFTVPSPTTEVSKFTNSTLPIHIIPNWDNADVAGFNEEMPEHPANRDFASCQQHCHEHSKCFQFTWHAHHCWMAGVMRMGQRKEPDGKHDEEGRKYVSGWDVEKIGKWIGENTCEEGPHWVKPSLKRRF
ncbi:hypothetical protein B0J11DRAFT_519178 [Dendryphion nanum]|uniref:N-acetylgalactosaminide beta-1,3-galactosyltransferase n=1 Tax=Dendryphion nanum TaxID=256645 RepID=A0A9P9EEP9_9PLEO|nr:hypothetical protein B0J11DRAFT_519178 [Dendryphion nanum]